MSVKVSAAARDPKALALAQEGIRLIKEHPQLSDEDKHATLWVLQQTPTYAALISDADVGVNDPPQWSHYLSLMGIEGSKQQPTPPEKVYKLRGAAEIDLAPEVRLVG